MNMAATTWKPRVPQTRDLWVESSASAWNEVGYYPSPGTQAGWCKLSNKLLTSSLYSQAFKDQFPGHWLWSLDVVSGAVRLLEARGNKADRAAVIWAVIVLRAGAPKAQLLPGTMMGAFSGCFNSFRPPGCRLMHRVNQSLNGTMETRKS